MEISKNTVAKCVTTTYSLESGSVFKCVLVLPSFPWSK